MLAKFSSPGGERCPPALTVFSADVRFGLWLTNLQDRHEVQCITALRAENFLERLSQVELAFWQED